MNKKVFAFFILVLLLSACGGEENSDAIQSPTDIPTAVTAPIQLGYSAENPVTRNADWTPVLQEFDGVAMVLVPAGCFRMGSTDDQIAAAIAECEETDSVAACNDILFSLEQPAAEICFETPFWIGRYEVTNAEYRECVEAGACTLPGDGVLTDATIYDDPNYANHPVIFVDWHQANDYAEWRGGRLPTEAEWEYAARGPDGLIYPWGNEIDATRVNFCDVNCRGYTWRDSNYDDGYAQTAPVGSYPGGVSWVGAYDLSGNIWEWISTIYQDYPYNATDGRESSLDAGSWRGWRGGAWYSTADLVRAGYRGRYVTTDRHHPAGIRIGRSFSPADIATAATTSIPVGYSAANPVTTNAGWTPVIQEFDGVEMALVPAGCFQMGSEDGESNERPVHEQCFDEPFWIDRYEVTNERYGSVGCDPHTAGADRPHVCTSWVAVRDFCERLGGRLPTEAEWEYAARGPDSLKYPWGNEFVADNVVYLDNQPGGNQYLQPAEVGSRPGGVSWVGAYDLSGNAWEWTSTIFRSYPYDANDGREDRDDSSNNERVVRGGSYGLPADVLSTTYRHFVLVGPDGPISNHIGFRCARSYSGNP